jgi:hypothetical protein
VLTDQSQLRTYDEYNDPFYRFIFVFVITTRNIVIMPIAGLLVGCFRVEEYCLLLDTLDIHDRYNVIVHLRHNVHISGHSSFQIPFFSNASTVRNRSRGSWYLYLKLVNYDCFITLSDILKHDTAYGTMHESPDESG